MNAAAEGIEVRFEGYTPAMEILGGIQANFLVRAEGHHAKEAAVVLNLPAAKAIADAVGAEDTPEFQERAARVAGEALLADLARRPEQLASVVTISRAYLEDHPALFERMKAALA